MKTTEEITDEAVAEKKHVALVSVFAAIFLTGSKLLIGLLTGSLGILSEALHSGLDLIAAAITYFSVRISDKPPDGEHHFGHGKIENLSALIETLLLLITCVWIIYEATHRLWTGNVHIQVTYWSYIVVICSIIIDYTRSNALSKTAKKHNSQALEADALHFSTDIWSSAVVLLGLICSNFGLYYADSISALFVATIVIGVCYKLGKKSIEVLLDKAPADLSSTILNLSKTFPQIAAIHDIKARCSGADIFIDFTVLLDPNLNLRDAHNISHKFEKLIQQEIKRCTVHVHQEPVENTNQKENGDSGEEK